MSSNRVLNELTKEYAQLRLRNKRIMNLKKLHTNRKKIEQRLLSNLESLNRQLRTKLHIATQERKKITNPLVIVNTRRKLLKTHEENRVRLKNQAKQQLEKINKNIAELQKAIAENKAAMNAEARTMARTIARAEIKRLVNTQREEEHRALREAALHRESIKNRLNAILAKSNKNIYKNTSNNNLQFFINKRAAVYGNAHKNKANKFARILKARRNLPAFKQTEQGKQAIARLANLKTARMVKRMPRFVSGFLNTLREQSRRKYAENLIKRIESQRNKLMAGAREAQREAKVIHSAHGGVMGFEVNMRPPPPVYNFITGMPSNKREYNLHINAMNLPRLLTLVQAGTQFWEYAQTNRTLRGNMPNAPPVLPPRPTDMSIREYNEIKKQYADNARSWLKTVGHVWLNWTRTRTRTGQ